MHSLSIFGTSSDAGKSTIAFVITYLLKKRGINVAPFKAQNVSNNSSVCDESGEIAQPQFFTAESISLRTTPDFNPILLKSGRGYGASLIVNGCSVDEQSVQEYYKNIDTLKPVVKSAFQRLQSSYEMIVAEGAGSPVELNLMQKDLSNIYIADTFNTKIVLVADIERGGVFASIWGVYNLLPLKLQKNVIGVIINKFRGELSLFDEGVKIIENRFGLNVLGVVPWKPFNLGFEDSQSIMGYTQDTKDCIVRVGIIKLPHISNFTDFEPLVVDHEVEVLFIDSISQIHGCDVLVVPGTRRTIDDLLWLRENGFEDAIKGFRGTIIGICGGYEMMFEKIIDANSVESEIKSVDAFGLIDGVVEFKEDKKVKKGKYQLFGMELNGYEIHHGVASSIGVKKDNFYGTFLHGLFDNDEFRVDVFKQFGYKGFNFTEYKKSKIESYTDEISKVIDIDTIINELKK